MKNTNCPECNGKLIKKYINYHQKISGKEIEIPDIEIFECDNCSEKIYPYKSAEQIEAYKNYSGRFVLRTNPVLHKRLVERAKKDRRSLNQEISILLEKSLSYV